MTMPRHDPFPRLADALIEVSARLQEISTELRTIAPPAPTAPMSRPAPPYAAPPRYPDARPVAPPYPAPSVPPPAPPPAQHHPAPDALPPLVAPEPGPTIWERLSREGAGSRFLAWIGGVVTLAGVLLLLVLAIQRGYIGPVPRLMLGVGLGGALVGAGILLHRTPGGRPGTHAVAATGIAVLYLDVIGATSFYAYLPPWAGLVAGLGVAAGAMLVALRWDSQPLATYVVLCCAASAPVLTRGAIVPLVGFLLVLQIATTPAQLYKRWGGLVLAAGAPPVLAVLAHALTAAARAGHGPAATTVGVLCLVTATVQIAVATLTARVRREDDGALGLVITGPVPTLLSALLVTRLTGLELVGALALILLAVSAARRPLGLPARFADSAAAAGLAAAFEATCLGFGGDVRAVALLAGAVLLALSAVRLRHPGAALAGALFGGAGSLLALGGAARAHVLAVAPVDRLAAGQVVTLGTTGVALAAAALTVAWAWVHTRASGPAHRQWILAGCVALYGATAAMLAVGLAVSPDERGFLIGHVLVTVSWTVGALVLLVRHAESVALRVTGLALVGAAVAKLVVFDLASLSGIPRVLAFLGAGLVLLAAGARYARPGLPRRS
jgi:uncharacterized membrane protein